MKKTLIISGFAAVVSLFGLSSTVHAQTQYYPYQQNPSAYQMPLQAQQSATMPIYPQGYAGYTCPAGYVLTVRNNAFTCMLTTSYKPQPYPAPYPYPTYPDQHDDTEFGLRIEESDDTPDDDVRAYRNQVSDWEEIFEFELTAGDEEVEIERLPITIEFDDARYNDMISDIMIEVDNDEYTRRSVSVRGDEAVITFRTDDLEIDENDTVRAHVYVRFRPASGNFDDGDSFRAFIDEDNIEDIETDNDLDEDEIDGEAEGEELEVDVRN